MTTAETAIDAPARRRRVLTPAPAGRRRVRDTPHAFIDICKMLREDSGLSETRYAFERLGLSPSQWSHVVQTQVRGPGGTFILALFRVYPTMTDLFGQALAGKLETLTRDELREMIDLCRPTSYASNVDSTTLVSLPA